MPHPPRASRARKTLRSLLVALATAAAVLSPARARQQQGAAGEVRFVVTVTDGKGRYMTGLDRSHFSVFEGKEARALTSFDGKDAPASVGVLVDVSGSTASLDSRLRDAVSLAVEELVRKGHPENQYFIAAFSTQGYVLTDWTSDGARLGEAIKQIGTMWKAKWPKGNNTALYDACGGALDRVAAGVHAKRVLVIVSDGQDNASRTSFRDLRRRIQESEALIYGIGLVERVNAGALDAGGQALLDEIAAQSGGRAFFPETRGEMIGAAELIAVELRRQYVVGFAAADAGVESKPKWRRVKIKLAPDAAKEVKKLHVRSREGYYHPRAGA